jgi:hypothetical protein
MKDKEPKLNPEQKFISLSEEIVSQLKKTCPEHNTTFTGIVINDTPGGTRALVIDSNGNWSGRVQMMGWPIGINPKIDVLVSEYASVTDKDYQLLEQNEDHKSGEIKTKEFIQKNKERLFNGLLTEMESVIEKLKTQK